MCLGVQRGLSRVLIKYSGKLIKIYFNIKITYLCHIFQMYDMQFGSCVFLLYSLLQSC